MRYGLIQHFVVASLALLTSTAHAQLPECSATPAMAWFAPAKNATDVPTDAVIFAEASPGTPLRVTLNGGEIGPRGDEGLDRITYPPGPLEPNTEYTLLFELGTGPTVKKVQAKFTTGAELQGEAPLAPVIGSHVAVTAAAEGQCGAVLAAQRCGEDAPAMWARVALEGSPVAWVAERGDTSIIVPVDCGAELIGDADEALDDAACWDLMSVDQAGQRSEPVPLCPFQVEESTGTTGGGGGGRGGGGGCSAGASGGPVGAVLLFLGMLAWRRRLFSV